MRLARLLAVRRVRLHAAARELGAAARTVALLEATHARLLGLRGELGIAAAPLDGYAAKSVTATRAALGQAGEHQAARLAGAADTHAAASDLTQHRRAAADAVERALDAQPVTRAPVEPPPLPRRGRR